MATSQDASGDQPRAPYEEYSGYKVYDENQEKIGKVDDLFVDENGQPLETPVQPSDLPVYKDAVADGVQIVQLKDLRQYFRF